MKTIYRNLLFFLLPLLAIGGYLIACFGADGVGFPLDDAWIHQTFARNFGFTGQWAFIPGKVAAGSTAPLWTALLALGYFFHIDFFLWAMFTGWICLSGIALASQKWFYFLLGGKEEKSVSWLFVMIAFEWHLVWAACSGMETLLFAWLVLAILGYPAWEKKQYAGLGVLLGLILWVRPDGLTLLGPVGWTILLDTAPIREKIKKGLQIFLPIFISALVYAAFNLMSNGSIFPNTFFAKQAEYAELQNIPFAIRWFDQFRQPLIGVGVLLFPGFIADCLRRGGKKDWKGLAPAMWLVGYCALFAQNLPVTYQHGRYIIPIIPIYIILSMVGLRWISEILHMMIRSKKVIWVNSTVWKFSAILTLIGFYGMGAYQYSLDVAIINTEMVHVAQWSREHITKGNIVAVHDIGAFGYYGLQDGVELIDLAGLISPEVIPIIRNEEALDQYLMDKKVDYLILFPDWYAGLTTSWIPYYSSNGKYIDRAGGKNLMVFRRK